MNRLVSMAVAFALLLSSFSAHARFIQADRWQGQDRQPITLNKYVYADVNPVNRTDPSGHFSIGEINTSFTIRNILTDLQINTGMNLADSHSMAQNDPDGEEYTDTLIMSAVTGMSPRVFNLIGKNNKRRLLKAAKIPWSNSSVKKVAGELVKGGKSVSVRTKSEAEELLLRLYHGKGYRNTSDMSPTEVKNFYNTKRGTYHWDTGVDDTGRVAGHGGKNIHGDKPHLQIHDEHGDIIRIFFDI